MKPNDAPFISDLENIMDNKEVGILIISFALTVRHRILYQRLSQMMSGLAYCSVKRVQTEQFLHGRHYSNRHRVLEQCISFNSTGNQI